MSKIIESVKRVNEWKSALRCPVCDGGLRVVGLQSVVCLNNHTFDFAKQGYLNLMPRPVNSHYNKELFEARHNIIMDSEFYTPLHETVAKIIRKYTGFSAKPFLAADLGCGEGSHLQKILDECQNPATTGVGLDISKDGILLASKRYPDIIWLVGDLAGSPLADQSFQVILNILSPSNYKEFKRILVQGGLVIKVVPRPGYLKELRKALFANQDKQVYQNDDTLSLFKRHFRLLDVMELSYTKNLKQDGLKQLAHMTPLSWSADPARIEAFTNQDSAEITVDLAVLVGGGI